jgi:hypothetical protein
VYSVLNVLSVLSYLAWRVCCLHELLFETNNVRVLAACIYAVMCIVLLSAGFMLNCV